jgi:hypothetical protein
MIPEQYQRGYLLPPGCKDLIDVLRLQELQKGAFYRPEAAGESAISGSESFSQVWKFKDQKSPAKPSSNEAFAQAGFFLEVLLPPIITVDYLASLLGRKPVQIIASLMEFGVFVTAQQKVGFEAAAKVLRQYGLLAKKA